MTASLHHAQPLLSAALNSGFRESGVQSLKNLDDSNAFPMVAVRTSGLALNSIVGFLCTDHDQESCQSIVDESYIDTLMRLANERFAANAGRIRRFEDALFPNIRTTELPAWEEGSDRKERKRKQGLERKAALHSQKESAIQENEIELAENISFDAF